MGRWIKVRDGINEEKRIRFSIWNVERKVWKFEELIHRNAARNTAYKWYESITNSRPKFYY